MSLATQCPTCGTAFRVVQDQLKISSGWVRCGKCDAVFNAVEALFDLRDDEPRTPAVDDVQSTQPQAWHDDDEPGQRPGDDPAGPLAGMLVDPIDAHIFGSRKRADVPKKPADYVGARDRLDFSDARFDSDLFADGPASGAGVEGDAPAAAEAPVDEPAFVRHADRRARWQSRPARLALGGGSLVALFLLVGQAVHHYRDAIAADWPATRPALVAGCRLAGCSLDAPRRIDDLHVESAALTRANGPDAYTLSVALRNRGRVSLLVPSVDLRLTDTSGQLIARRVLGPRDFHAAETIAPSGELTLQAPLATGSLRVAGYTVEIFYP